MMTSPLRMISISAPTPSPFFSRNPALCAVTQQMVAPDRLVAATRSTGVTLPVRPTCQTTSSTVVRAVSPLHLMAICQR